MANPEIKHSSQESERLDVYESTKQEAKDLENEVKNQEDRIPARWKEFINWKETINDDEVEELFDIIYPFSNLNNWDEMVSVCEKKYWDTRVIVLLIQLLLEKIWYKINKIDWLLKSKNSNSSETMDAVKLFQKENWIRPVDWIPWPKTFKKILQKFYIDKYKENITDFELSKRVIRANADDGWWGSVYLYTTELTDNQANLLWKVRPWDVGLPFIERISDSQAKELWKVCKLEMPILNNLTDTQAKYLNNVDYLQLHSLNSITDTQARFLSQKTNKYLFLDWLTNITDKQAEYLSKVENLQLRWLTGITDKQAIYLSKVKNLNLNENILTPKQKEILKWHNFGLQREYGSIDKQREIWKNRKKKK